MEPTPQTEIGLVGRMIRIFYAPGETFEFLVRKHSAADWLVPAILSAVVVTVAAVLVLPITTELNQEAMQQRMQSMSAEEREVVEQYQTQGIMQASILIVTPIVLFIFLFLFAACYLVMGKLLGGLLSYGQVLAIVAYGGLVTIPQQVVKTLLILAQKTPLVQIGLGMFLSEETLQSFSGRLLSAIDPFVIWSVVITGLGLSIVGQLDRSKAYAGVGVITLIWLSLASALGSIGQSFGSSG